jgi:hypothetical protein
MGGDRAGTDLYETQAQALSARELPVKSQGSREGIECRLGKLRPRENPRSSPAEAPPLPLAAS